MNAKPKMTETSDQLPSFLIPDKKPYHHFESTYTSTEVHFYLTQEIGDAYDYTEMFHRLYTATAADVIYIHLNTPGGQLDTGIQLMNAMKNSAAQIITCLECNAFSLGTLLFLSGDQMLVNDHCLLMFHDYSSLTGGKSSEQITQVTAMAKWFTNLLKKVYVPFLTEAEVDKILRGEDLWMASPEIKTRLNKMIKLLTDEAAQPKKSRVKKSSSAETP